MVLYLSDLYSPLIQWTSTPFSVINRAKLAWHVFKFSPIAPFLYSNIMPLIYSS